MIKINLKEILEEISKNKRSLIITLPTKIKWNDYEKELQKVKNYEEVLNFKVHAFPKGIKKGDKCYVVYNGFIKGWMEIVGFSEETFTCSTTNKKWRGKFIQRSGPFHYMTERLAYEGFRGFRYFDIEEYKLKKNIN